MATDWRKRLFGEDEKFFGIPLTWEGAGQVATGIAQTLPGIGPAVTSAKLLNQARNLIPSPNNIWSGIQTVGNYLGTNSFTTTKKCKYKYKDN